MSSLNSSSLLFLPLTLLRSSPSFVTVGFLCRNFVHFFARLFSWVLDVTFCVSRLRPLFIGPAHLVNHSRVACFSSFEIPVVKTPILDMYFTPFPERRRWCYRESSSPIKLQWNFYISQTMAVFS